MPRKRKNKSVLICRNGELCWSNVPREDCSGDGRTRKEDIPEKTQCLISIGGDGTLIRAARNLAGLNIPILGVNRGHLGYLNQVNRDDDLEPALDQLLEDRFQIEERMMLCGEAWKGDSLAMKDIALNEIALIRKSVLNALRFFGLCQWAVSEQIFGGRHYRIHPHRFHSLQHVRRRSFGSARGQDDDYDADLLS